MEHVKITTKVALREIREAFEGDVERLELKTEDDVVDLVKQFRND